MVLWGYSKIYILWQKNTFWDPGILIIIATPKGMRDDIIRLNTAVPYPQCPYVCFNCKSNPIKISFKYTKIFKYFNEVFCQDNEYLSLSLLNCHFYFAIVQFSWISYYNSIHLLEFQSPFQSQYLLASEKPRGKKDPHATKPTHLTSHNFF